MSSLMNKVKEALHSDKDKDKQQQQQQQHGKDSSQSKSHPRSESEREQQQQREAYERQNEPYTTSDNYAYGGGAQTQAGTQGGTAGVYDDRQAANRGARGPASSTDGPHGSNMANKMDPRVDSDRDYSRNMGMNPDRSATTGGQQQGYGTGAHGVHDTHGAHGAHGVHDTHGAHHGGLGGGRPDPRHDPDFESAQDEPRTGAYRGTGGTGYGASGGGGMTDPTGPAPHTAGPHKSDMMNKMDPRVDSDRDGSKTYMGDQTYPRQ